MTKETFKYVGLIAFIVLAVLAGYRFYQAPQPSTGGDSYYPDGPIPDDTSKPAGRITYYDNPDNPPASKK